MILTKEKVAFTTYQLGPLQNEEVHNALRLANSVQTAFEFIYDPSRFEVAPKYQLKNNGWDLESAVQDIVRKHKLSKPLVFISGLPYSTKEYELEADNFFFGDYMLGGDRDISIVSTHLWNSFPGKRRLQPYILMSMALLAFGYRVNIEIHDEEVPKGSDVCLFDYNENPKDILRTSGICNRCEEELVQALRAGRLSFGELAGSWRLLNRALDRKTAFIIMPFNPKLNQVHKTVASAIDGVEGWDVCRADEIIKPGRITDRIVIAIMTSDLVIVDLSGHNPNVFYELGFAHAAGKNVILIMREDEELPIDVRVEHVIRYTPTPAGLRKLRQDLTRHIEPKQGKPTPKKRVKNLFLI